MNAKTLRMHCGTGWDIIVARADFAACGGVVATDVVKRYRRH